MTFAVGDVLSLIAAPASADSGTPASQVSQPTLTLEPSVGPVDLAAIRLPVEVTISRAGCGTAERVALTWDANPIASGSITSPDCSLHLTIKPPDIAGTGAHKLCASVDAVKGSACRTYLLLPTCGASTPSATACWFYSGGFGGGPGHQITATQRQAMAMQDEHDRLSRGTYYYNTPATASASVDFYVSLLVSRQPQAANLEGAAPMTAKAAPISDLLDASLTADHNDAFQIQRVRGEQQQVILETAPGYWVWRVSPLKPGKDFLRVQVTLDMTSGPLTMPTTDWSGNRSPIEVKPSVQYVSGQAKDFLVWILGGGLAGTLVGVVGGELVKRWFARRSGRTPAPPPATPSAIPVPPAGARRGHARSQPRRR